VAVRRLTSLLFVKLGCYGKGGCPGLYENALDEGVRGQENIMDINSLPVCKQPAPFLPVSPVSVWVCLPGRCCLTRTDRQLCKYLI